MYFARILGSFCPEKYFKKRDKLIKLYDLAEERIDKEMNMVKPVNKPRCIIKIHKIGFAIFAKPRIKDQW